jgi:Ni,Fe-hydrogenase III small subunit
MIFDELKIFSRHGRQYIRDLCKVELTPMFRGLPVIREDITVEEAQNVSKICPSGAIQPQPFSIDLGKCMFCKECQFVLPGKIRFTNDPKMAVLSREDLVVTAGDDQPLRINRAKIRKEIRSFFKPSLKLRQVSAGGDNSCEMELNAAGNVNFDMGRFGIEFVASPRHADGIVITGPVTRNMAEAVQICYDAIAEPRIIVLAGTDAISGGLFAGSEALDRNFIDRHFIDLYIPGNPPHPLTFINGVLDLIGK